MRRLVLTVLMVAASVAPIARADSAGKPESSDDHPIWTHSAGGSVPLGSGLPEFNRLIRNLLGERSPCAAVALLSFTQNGRVPAQWQITLTGQPTAKTVSLVASRAQPAAVNQSTRYVGSMPFDPVGGTYVSVRITTEAIGVDRARSVIVCGAVDANGTALSQAFLETPVRFDWSPKDAQLLALYRMSAGERR